MPEVAPLLVPGDIVEIDGDTTYEGGVVLDQPGTEAEPIVIRGLRVNGVRPIFSGGSNTLETRANHYIVEGVDLTGGTARCFYNHAHNVTLRDSIVHDCPAQGIVGGDTDTGSLLLEFVEVHHCGTSAQHHQVNVATDQNVYPGSVFRMQHCYVHDGTGANNVRSRAERNEIYCNWIEGAPFHELELVGPDDGVGTGGLREDSDVVGNVLRKTVNTYVARLGGDGTGETQGRYRFVNNTIITQPGGAAVFRLFDTLESVEMHNNVFYGLNGSVVDLMREVDAFWTNGRQVAGSNNWAVSNSSNLPPEWTGTLTGSDPLFFEVAGWDLAPMSGSPLQDAGTMDTAASWDYGIPNPLLLPNCVPPTREVHTTSLSRSDADTIDIGAYEAIDGGAGGVAGADGSGGASTTDSVATSSGGSSAETSNGNTTVGEDTTGNSTSTDDSATTGGGSNNNTSASAGGSSSEASNDSSTGAAGAAGADGSGGSGGSGGISSSAGGTSNNAATASEDSGCDCRIAVSTRSRTPGGFALALALLGFARLRRRVRPTSAG